jgi:hypothetical protein
MDMNSLRGFGRAAWIRTMDIHGCRNADKKISLILLVYNAWSGIPASDFHPYFYYDISLLVSYSLKRLKLEITDLTHCVPIEALLFNTVHWELTWELDT